MMAQTLSHNAQYGQRRREVRLRLFCFPYAGRGASLFPQVESCFAIGRGIVPGTDPWKGESSGGAALQSRLAPLVEGL